ncbi:MAG: hypothetical protein ABSH36_04920 [Solirubrobacteraceae bacterium]
MSLCRERALLLPPRGEGAVGVLDGDRAAGRPTPVNLRRGKPGIVA